MGKIHGGVALKTPTEPANRNYTPTSPSRPSARSVPPAHTGSFERPSASLHARHLAIQFFQHKDFGVHSTKSQRRTQKTVVKEAFRGSLQTEANRQIQMKKLLVWSSRS